MMSHDFSLDQPLLQVPISIMLVDMRVEGLPLQFCNQAAVELTGYSKEQMVGRNCKFMQGRPSDSTETAAVRVMQQV